MIRTRKHRTTIVVSAALAATMFFALPVAANTHRLAPRGGTTLTLWYSSLDPPALLNLYSAYQTATGNKLNLVPIPNSTYPATVLTKWQTGQRPDILEFEPGIAQLAALNPPSTLVDLTKLPFVKREGGLAKISGYFFGKTYGATLGPNATFGIYYNKSVLKKAGLKPPASFGDLFADCKVLKSRTLFEAGGDGWPPYGLAGDLYESQFNIGGAYNSALLAGKATISNPKGPFVKGLVQYNKLSSDGCFNSDATTATFGQSVQALLNGQTAMVAQISSAIIPQLNADENNNLAKVDSLIGFAGVSATEPVTSTSPNLIGTFFVPKTGNTATQTAAIGFINWITGPGYAGYVRQGETIPTLSGIRTPKTIQALYIDISKAQKLGVSPSWLTSLPASTAMAALLDQVLAKQITPQVAGQKMQFSFQQAVTLLKQSF